jgi:hypothetical protein
MGASSTKQVQFESGLVNPVDKRGRPRVDEDSVDNESNNDKPEFGVVPVLVYRGRKGRARRLRSTPKANFKVMADLVAVMTKDVAKGEELFLNYEGDGEEGDGEEM